MEGSGFLNGSVRAGLSILLYLSARIIEHCALADFVGHPSGRGGVKVNSGHTTFWAQGPLVIFY